MSGTAADLQAAAQEGDPLAHALQPERLRLSYRAIHFESDAIILDIQF